MEVDSSSQVELLQELNFEKEEHPNSFTEMRVKCMNKKRIQ